MERRNFQSGSLSLLSRLEIRQKEFYYYEIAAQVRIKDYEERIKGLEG